MGETAAGDTPSGVWPGSLLQCEPAGQGDVRQQTKKGRRGLWGALQEAGIQCPETTQVEQTPRSSHLKRSLGKNQLNRK